MACTLSPKGRGGCQWDVEADSTYSHSFCTQKPTEALTGHLIASVSLAQERCIDRRELAIRICSSLLQQPCSSAAHQPGLRARATRVHKSTQPRELLVFLVQQPAPRSSIL